MVLRETFHVLMASIFAFAIYYDLYQLRIPDVMRIRHEKSAGRWKYLTFWNLISQAVFFSLSFVNDILIRGSTNKPSHKNLQGFLDAMFASVGFPVAIFVGGCFWLLMTIDRELVLPTMFDTFFPKWLNHIMHTLIIPAVLLEMIFIYHLYPNRKKSLAILTFFTTTYLLWTFFVAYMWQFWTYPILEVLTWGQRISFIVACVAFTWVFYFFGELLHKAVWVPTPKNEENAKPIKMVLL
ncbi:hypothetical protein CHUAL_001449 [Chamberlinius hualienensis]